MADLGLYNFITNKLAEGQTKEQITALLVKGGQAQLAIDDAFTSVERGTAPIANEHSMKDLGIRPEATVREMEQSATIRLMARNVLIIVIVSALGTLPVSWAGNASIGIDVLILAWSGWTVWQVRAARLAR